MSRKVQLVEIVKCSKQVSKMKKNQVGCWRTIAVMIKILLVTTLEAIQFSSDLTTTNHLYHQHQPSMEHSLGNGTSLVVGHPAAGAPMTGALQSQSINLFPPNLAGTSDTLQLTNYYSNTQAQKFRVNVSNVCEKNNMRATIRLNRPFYGLIHTKDKRRRSGCTVEGMGGQSYSIEISYTLNPSDPNHCGVVSHQVQPARLPAQNHSSGTGNQPQKPQLTLSVVLVVRLHKTIEFSDDRYFLLSCANRCSRPDCSPETARGAANSMENASKAENQDSSRSSATGRARTTSFAADESIVSPIIRTSNIPPKPSSAINLTEVVGSAAGGWQTERCDTMLDLKFQWLVKLCWILSTMVAMMLCASLYLCLNFCRSSAKQRKDRPRDKRSLRSSSCSSSSISCNGNNSSSNLILNSGPKQQQQQQQVMYSPQQVAEPSTWSKTLEHDQHSQMFAEQMREENNLYLLARQQQQQRQIMLANLNLMTQQASNNFGGHPNLGRSADGSHHMGRAAQQPLKARVRRRRSIGSSAATCCNDDLAETGRSSRMIQSSALTTSQRAKSRSQTTIHYEQSQDPFKTVPFNYVATRGEYHTPDGTNPNRVYLASDFVGLEVYGMPPTPRETYMQTFASNQDSNESISQSLPPQINHHLLPDRNSTSTTTTTTTTNNMHNVTTRRENGQWTEFKPNFVPPPQMELAQGNKKTIVQPKEQHQTLEQSQFDPQNSRQLINLIQQKHRQQLEQANRTAASLQSSSEAFVDMQRQQQSSQMDQQQNSNMGRPTWR